MVSLTVNGVSTEVDAEPATPLLWVLREHLKLTGKRARHLPLTASVVSQAFSR